VTARTIALQALAAIDAGGRANVVVPRLLSASALDSRDRNLVTELVYGTCRMRRACDWLVDQHTRGQVDPTVRAALRLGAYQIGWTRVPPHAAVSATVEEVRGPGKSLVNAVLRRVATEVTKGLVTWPDRATELSYPDWIVERLVADLGRDNAHSALLQMNEPASVTVRADGYIQDEGSQMVSAHLAPHLVSAGARGRALDLCAAPGGKATALASGQPGLVVAADLSPERALVIASNVSRLGISEVVTVIADGTTPPFPNGSFDLVLVDAPCSGLGVLRRRPDARWRIQKGDVERLGALQRRLLMASIPLLRPGGVLAYSVCTLTTTETAGIDNWLAKFAPQLKPLPPPQKPWSPAGRGALLLPQEAGTDGMYLLSLRAP
jgi:16S rRNA (cytosine967-C5)-methyltransferase